MRRAVALVNALNIALVLGDASKHIEDCGGTTNFLTDRVNVTVKLKENREENGFTLCE